MITDENLGRIEIKIVVQCGAELQKLSDALRPFNVDLTKNPSSDISSLKSARKRRQSIFRTLIASQESEFTVMNFYKLCLRKFLADSSYKKFVRDLYSLSMERKIRIDKKPFAKGGHRLIISKQMEEKICD